MRKFIALYITGEQREIIATDIITAIFIASQEGRLRAVRTYTKPRVKQYTVR